MQIPNHEINETLHMANAQLHAGGAKNLFYCLEKHWKRET